MLLSDLILKTPVENKDDLERQIRIAYPFLDKETSLSLIKECFLETDNLVFKKTDGPVIVTYRDLVEYISKVFVLKDKIKAGDVKKAEAHESLADLYEQTVWNKLMGVHQGMKIEARKYTEIREDVWECFLGRLTKSNPFRLFCIEDGRLAFRQELFQEYISDQLILYSFRQSMNDLNNRETILYQNRFERKLDQIIRRNYEIRMNEEDYKDMVADRMMDFLKVIRAENFRLTSTLDTYLYGFINNGVKNYRKYNSKAPHLVQIGKEAMGLTAEELGYLEKEEIRINTKLVIRECSKGKYRERYMVRSANLNKKNSQVGRELSVSESNVSTIKSRFIFKLTSALRNRKQ